ncbi:MAG: hypothetical protein NC418_11830 [Muribaculaceae bacterium]|nr:hypothetical protein [Muribaculaceae bacterium]
MSTEKNNPLPAYARAKGLATRAMLEAKLDSKADRSELSNVLATDPLTPWEEPELPAHRRLFVEMWCAAWGRFGSYDATREKPFIGNGVEMSFEEAVPVLMRLEGQSFYLSTPTYAAQRDIRTNIPPHTYGGQNYSRLFLDCYGLEVANLADSTSVTIGTFGNCFLRCHKLRKVLPTLIINDKNVAFRECEALEDFDITITAGATVYLGDSPLVSAASLELLVKRAPAAAAAVVTLHPEAYARLSDDLLSSASAKNITFATA